MKVLWIVNIILPEPSNAIGMPTPVVGGWLFNTAEQLRNVDDISLAIATTYSGKEIMEININGIAYFLLPSKKSSLEKNWKIVVSKFEPNLVHIHGTEFSHGLACMRALPNLNYIISIQGLISIIAKYYWCGMSFFDVLSNITFRDFLRNDTIFHQQRSFRKRGRTEIEYIKKIKNVIGRTSWDYSHTKALNPQIEYHFCNESIRLGFYSAQKWSLSNCTPYTIFLSQAGYPVKGLHQLVKAVALLKKDFPLIQIKIGGGNITSNQTLLEKLKLSGYGKYIRKLLKKEKLEQNFIFLGELSEEKMIEQFQKANIFICPSSIENSSNSIGEAQIIGVPVIASYVGGIPDLVDHNKSGLLYRFEEIEMLAENIRSIFINNNNLAIRLSKKGIAAASLRHNINVNLNQLQNIYFNINKNL